MSCVSQQVPLVGVLRAETGEFGVLTDRVVPVQLGGEVVLSASLAEFHEGGGYRRAAVTPKEVVHQGFDLLIGDALSHFRRSV